MIIREALRMKYRAWRYRLRHDRHREPDAVPPGEQVDVRLDLVPIQHVTEPVAQALRAGILHVHRARAPGVGAEFRAAIPEPESILLLPVGLLGILATRRKLAAWLPRRVFRRGK